VPHQLPVALIHLAQPCQTIAVLWDDQEVNWGLQQAGMRVADNREQERSVDGMYVASEWCGATAACVTARAVGRHELVNQSTIPAASQDYATCRAQASAMNTSLVAVGAQPK
jgi:hypothetical protein